MCLLRLKNQLITTSHQAKFCYLDLNNLMRSAVIDIDDKLFWKALYIPLRDVFPMLWAICFSDSNTPAMDKIYYLSHQASVAIEKAGNALNNETISVTLETDNELKVEVNEVFGERNNERYASTKLSWYCLLHT